MTSITTIEIILVKAKLRSWDIEIKYEGQVSPRTLNDPLCAPNCPPSLLRDYVENAHRDTTNHAHTSNGGRGKIVGYRNRLLRDLSLPIDLRNGKVRLVIIEDPDELGPNDVSLHTIAWEILESRDDANANFVTITRVMVRNGTEVPTLYHPMSRPLKILLIIGRNISRTKAGSLGEDPIQPDVIQHPLMQIVDHLNSIKYGKGIELECLRPSSFDELERYVARSADYQKFNLVHVDMHGLLDKGEAKFQFTWTESEEDRDEMRHSATEIARTLQRLKGTVVFNACNQSNESGLPGVDMFLPFLEEGVYSLTGTNFSLAERTAKTFYPHFYLSYLLFGCMHDAASLGRSVVKNETGRFEDTSSTHRPDDSIVLSNWMFGSYNRFRGSLLPYSLSWVAIVEKAMTLSIFGIVYSLVQLLLSAEWLHQKYSGDRAYLSLSWNFGVVEAHSLCSQQMKVPRYNFNILEIEYYLKKNKEMSVYVYPRQPYDLRSTSYAKKVVGEMVDLWTRTKFVDECIVISISDLLRSNSSMIHRSIRSAAVKKSRSIPLQQKVASRAVVLEDVHYLREPRRGLPELRVKWLLEDRIHALESVLEVIQRLDLESGTGGVDYLVSIGERGEEGWKLNLKEDRVFKIMDELTATDARDKTEVWNMLKRKWEMAKFRDVAENQ